MSEESSYQLQTEEISTIILPHEGGRVSSLRSKASGLEFLTQSHRSGEYPQPSLDTPFRVGPCAGIEECLPTVAPCGTNSGSRVPDHGDFWQIPWRVLEVSERHLTIEADGFSRTLRFHKSFQLEGNALRIQYKISNTGEAPQSFLYACHPLFAVEAGDRIVLPDEVKTLRLDYSKENRLGRRGDQIQWPTATPNGPLDIALSGDSGIAEMLYTTRLRSGVCSLQRATSDETLDVSFSTDELPYLGIWLCYGGWPDDAGDGHLQYAVALEPTTAPWNSLQEAEEEGMAICLKLDECHAFEITFRVRQG